MTEFAVHVQTDAPTPEDDDITDAVMDALALWHVSLSGDTLGRLGAQLTVDASDLHEAAALGGGAVARALVGAGAAAPGGVAVVAVEVATPEEFERRLAEPPDLMGTGEIAERLGVSRQRVLVLADTHPAFPSPVGGRGLTWHRPAVERFAGLERAPGRHVATQAGG